MARFRYLTKRELDIVWAWCSVNERKLGAEHTNDTILAEAYLGACSAVAALLPDDTSLRFVFKGLCKSPYGMEQRLQNDAFQLRDRIGYLILEKLGLGSVAWAMPKAVPTWIE